MMNQHSATIPNGFRTDSKRLSTLRNATPRNATPRYKSPRHVSGVAASHHGVGLGDARDRDGMMRRHLTPAEFAAEWDRRTFGSMGVER